MNIFIASGKNIIATDNAITESGMAFPRKTCFTIKQEATLSSLCFLGSISSALVSSGYHKLYRMAMTAISKLAAESRSLIFKDSTVG